MFKKAVPVWYDNGFNTNLIFSAKTNSEGGVLHIAASDFYKVFMNGEFLGYGPARTAKGYARVDEYTLKPEADIRIEVAGYGCCSLSTIKQPSFCCAEIISNGQIIAATGDGFSCHINRERRQIVERYSLQRHFSEIYDIGELEEEVETSQITAPYFLERIVPYADFSLQDASLYIGGDFTEGPQTRINAYSGNLYKTPNWGIIPESEIADKPFRFVNSLKFSATFSGNLPVTLSSGQWIMLDLGGISSGFPILNATAHENCEIILALTEYCEDDSFSFVKGMNCQPVLQYNLKAGQHIQKEAFEPYSFKKAAIIIKSGKATINAFGLRNYIRDMTDAKQLKFDDSVIQGIYDAALRTFSHNAIDIFTDCPSRERAGWLCDSYFTAQAEYFLFGKTPVEDAFLQNYILYKSDGSYPKGVLPMTYPSDPCNNNEFIPQWDMWYVLEVCEYLTVRNPSADKQVFWESVSGILSFLEAHENEWGLLENLPSWNFVEWSKANHWVQDVNYPTNFLYAEMLEKVEQTFGVPYKQKVKNIREEVIKRSFNGDVFVDHAKREGNELINYSDVSEACQYYAVLFGSFDLNTPKFAKLKASIIDGFISRKDEGFCRINAFIGMYLRMGVLKKIGDYKLLTDNIKAFFGCMREKTFTLWEYKEVQNSLDHGFASYVITLMKP